jgi:hypothetical protein
MNRLGTGHVILTSARVYSTSRQSGSEDFRHDPALDHEERAARDRDDPFAGAAARLEAWPALCSGATYEAQPWTGEFPNPDASTAGSHLTAPGACRVG